MNPSNTRKCLYLLDLDDTIFDATAFKLALPRAANSAFGISASEFAAQISSHYDVTPGGESIGYNVFEHLKVYGVNLAVDETLDLFIQTMFRVHQQEPNGQADFLFPDVRDALLELKSRKNANIQGWSINNRSCLIIKQTLCGSALEEVTFMQLTGNKGHYLQTIWKNNRLTYSGVEYSEVVVLDDKPDQLEAVPDMTNVSRVQIVRPGQKYPANTSGITYITSFPELLNFPRA